MENIEENWKEGRENILNVVISSFHIKGICRKCHTENAIIFCDCCVYKCLCRDCDNEIHSLLPVHNSLLLCGWIKLWLKPLEGLDEKMCIVLISKYK